MQAFERGMAEMNAADVVAQLLLFPFAPLFGLERVVFEQSRAGQMLAHEAATRRETVALIQSLRDQDFRIAVYQVKRCSFLVTDPDPQLIRGEAIGGQLLVVTTNDLDI